LATIDFIIIGVYFAILLSINLYLSKRAGRSTSDFFISGRNFPWWIAGTAMVATTFAADTPLAVTELVARNGIAGNWLWWNMLIGSMLTVFFFAKLWRRAGIMTDVELIEIRYSGKPAAFLRGFRAIYIGMVMNVIVIAWVNLALEKIIRVMFPGLTFLGVTEITILGVTFSAALMYVACVMMFVGLYASLAGLWGLAITDMLQFTVAMGSMIILAVTALNLPEIGGMSGLMEKVPEGTLSFTPLIGTGTGGAGEILALSVAAFVAHIAVQWWASWYPGAEPGGGGYVAQRMFSTKDEKNSLYATLWFTIAHYAVRPWPWIIVALVSVVLYPELGYGDKGDGFVMVMRDYLPAGLLGLLVAAFLAAYMSTLGTQLNWGASYVINDLYRRFIYRDKSEKHYVLVSRLATVFILLISLVVTANLQRITAAWEFIITASGGIGMVLILRWYWWRINAWSEISALIAPFVFYALILWWSSTLPPDAPIQAYLVFPYTLFYIVAMTTVIWLAVTFMTKPVDEKVLVSFYERVKPGGRLWKPISDKMPHVKPQFKFKDLLICWISGVVMVYMALFGMGKLLFGEHLLALVYFAIAAVGAYIISVNIRRDAKAILPEA
jgi:solute:Na+ symporter, SSS family